MSPFRRRREPPESLPNQIVEEREVYVVVALTVNTPGRLQTSLGKDASNGDSRFWVPHNVSNTGFSKPLRQRASATVVALDPDVTSSQAISLTISSMLRQGCIRARRRVQQCIDDARNKDSSQSMPMLLERVSSSRARQFRARGDWNVEDKPYSDGLGNPPTYP